MLKFDPQDPFPLIDLAAVPYPEQKAHASEADQWLGFEIEKVEAAIERQEASREQVREQWIGLPPQSLLTPYVELRRMLFEAGQHMTLDRATVVDIGAAYGRLAFVLAAHAPTARFVGMEISGKRVEEGNRVMHARALARAQLIHADALTDELPPGQLYFMYDFGSPKSIRTILEKLKHLAQIGSITVIGRGRATRDEIERKHPWLSNVHEPVHRGNFTIYRS